MSTDPWAPHHLEPAVAAALDRKRAHRGTTTYVLSQLDDLAARLDAFLVRRVDGTFSVRDLERLPGGASKEQFVFTLDRVVDGEPRSDRLVLRMDPLGSPVESSRRREADVLRMVHGVLPVPELHWATDDADELGAPSLISEFVSGVTGPADAPTTASGLGVTYGPRLRPVLAEQFVEHLAALHTVDWSAHELEAFERPRPGTTDALDWRLAAIDRAWDDDAFAPHPTVALVRDWLWRNRPTVDTVSVVHGDYRNGNFLFDEKSGRITAVLDWELTYLGDRHHDLAYIMMEGWGERDEATGTFWCSALVTEDDLIAQYEARSGLSVDRERLRYYLVLNMYWAIVALTAALPRNAAEELTHLAVMGNFLTGLGTYYIDRVNEIVATEPIGAPA
ncbi:phosphotransferase family protein [Curtobacterium sp. MCBD17_040]|uniref:phosphotransferase family protein n=1 Tax=Curtobacterium sp. MCBD17_040 TaxID=2175674 RepID=UPI000DA95089|nr:phosphotransferase family protein [Curtobacterium sp. MCBD17_040]WIB63341.1 phosphotransferase family protein [Curtobacterium sp. MCBD17_040]